MAVPQYLYDIDDCPPWKRLFAYGLQWAVIMFPALVVVSSLSAGALSLDPAGNIRFFQLTLLASGSFSAVQCLWGHRYPVLDGPATALLLTFMVLAPHGLPAVQGGTILGGVCLVLLVWSGQLGKVARLATPRVVGVILLLVALTLMPYLARSMAGMTSESPNGNAVVLFTGMGLTLFMAALSDRLRGFWKSISLLAGMGVGTTLFYLAGAVDGSAVSKAGWIALPPHPIPSAPELYWPAVAAFVVSYVAVVVNSLGSLHGIAEITDEKRLSVSVSRGIFLNGLAGICCGFMGIVGMVSYSMSPGVVLASRVASRYAAACCGGILVLAAFVPKLAACLSSVPDPVVAAALCAAMGVQVGAAISLVSAGGMTFRDYHVVGLPVLIGCMSGFLPEPFLNSLSPSLRIFLGNGVVVGIFFVLLLEHVLLRRPGKDEGEK